MGTAASGMLCGQVMITPSPSVTSVRGRLFPACPVPLHLKGALSTPLTPPRQGLCQQTGAPPVGWPGETEVREGPVSGREEFCETGC